MIREEGVSMALSQEDGVRGELFKPNAVGEYRLLTSDCSYFNTVGSKEGWVPSTFVSSRANRRKDDEKTTIEQRAEAYMDEEDLVDAAEAQKLQTSDAFAGLGSSGQGGVNGGGLMGLLRAAGDTKGLHLLRCMGWKTGQGIGPKVRRNARLDIGTTQSNTDKNTEIATHLFAPDDEKMIQFVRKIDRKGLGYQGGAKLRGFKDDSDQGNEEDGDNAEEGETISESLFKNKTRSDKRDKGGIGVGILNDVDDDEEDPYDMGPKISYNRAIGDKKKSKMKKKTSTAINPNLGNAPTFVPKTARAGNSLRRCHDGRLPLDGFVLAKVVEDLASLFLQYAPPSVPDGWKSAKDPLSKQSATAYTSASDAAKTSTLDPRARAALLGEAALPGKSVFDFLSSSARDKLASASGNQSLPPGLGELPEGTVPLTSQERRDALAEQAPKLDQSTAAAALSRVSDGPYADDEAKRTRYRRYLSWQASPGRTTMPEKPAAVPDDGFLKELHEFYNCARIFKPMTGFMASRFTSSKTTSATLNPSSADDKLISKPEPKPLDPAEDAAKMGAFGPLTRSTQDFYPTRLLCKRFNVRPPMHVAPENGEEQTRARAATVPTATWNALPAPPAEQPAAIAKAADRAEVNVNPEKNDAVEGKTANEDILKAIFGDSDDDD